MVKLQAASRLLAAEDDHREHLERTGFWGRQGAGCLIMAEDTSRLCWPLRSQHVQEPGTYGTWGGAIDADENPMEAVGREVVEEAGYHGKIKFIPLLVFKKPEFVYYNFLAMVPREFKPRLNWETQEADWREVSDWPHPLHPGVQALLKHGPSLAKIIAMSKKFGRA